MTRRLREFTILCGISLAVAGCPDDAGGDTDGQETEGADETGPDAECDPVGALPEVGALLNAPLEADVEVIQKTPQHPNKPGPVGLP